MRLWHKDLISVLPRQQLIGQWRELCCIAKNIAENGTPNHLLVNKVMEYPLNHLNYYGCLIAAELSCRGYAHNSDNFQKWLKNDNGENPFPYPFFDELFQDWHNDRYFVQCFYNLQEKFDCGGISAEEFYPIDQLFLKKMQTIKMDAERM